MKIIILENQVHGFGKNYEYKRFRYMVRWSNFGYNNGRVDLHSYFKQYKGSNESKKLRHEFQVFFDTEINLIRKFLS